MAPPPAHPERLAPAAWRTSYWSVAAIAIGIGLLAIVLSIALDWGAHGSRRRIYASDWLEGATAAILSGLALQRMQARRRELLVRMQIVEDVNHHVRNALTAIVLSASLREDAELDALVRDACDRIDWVLSDVLSQSVDATGLASRQSAWGSGLQLDKPANPPASESTDPSSGA